MYMTNTQLENRTITIKHKMIRIKLVRNVQGLPIKKQGSSSTKGKQIV